MSTTRVNRFRSTFAIVSFCVTSYHLEIVVKLKNTLFIMSLQELFMQTMEAIDQNGSSTTSHTPFVQSLKCLMLTSPQIDEVSNSRF